MEIVVETHFRKTRRLVAVAALVIPLMLWLAFVAFAAGHGDSSLILAFPAWILGMFMPWRRRLRSEVGKPLRFSVKGALSMIWEIPPAILIVVWLVDGPWKLMKHFVQEGGLWDWRVIAATAFWTLNCMIRNWNSTRNLSDREIFDFIDRSEAPPEKNPGDGA